MEPPKDPSIVAEDTKELAKRLSMTDAMELEARVVASRGDK